MENESTTTLTGKEAKILSQEWKNELDQALEKICKTKKAWLWFICILAASPGVLNGMHVTSYVFFVYNFPHYCTIPALESAGWTSDQIRNISSPPSNYVDTGCKYYNFNYSQLADKTFDEAVNFTRSTTVKPNLLPCADYTYDNKDTVISEWNLVCERFYYRSNIQASYAVGKFFGASFFGIIADKYGRKRSFTAAAVSYLISAVLSGFSNSFSIFLIIRFLIGFGGVGCYGTAYTLLSEVLVGPARTWGCCLFNVSYAIGIMSLSILAYYIRYWKSLQIIMSIPTVILPFYYWFLPESPQWLLSKGRFREAWKVIKGVDPSIPQPSNIPKNYQNTQVNLPLYQKLMQPFTEFMSMFSTLSLTIRSVICFYIWFTLSATYFGLVLNGDNFHVDRYLYVFLNGLLEMFSYALPVPLLAVSGRKPVSLAFFSFSGIGLISIFFVPKALSTVVLVVALFSRFCVSSVFVIFTLYTSELFPTAIRNTAIGASITMSHVGTLVSPYIVDILGAYRWYIPSTLFGILAVGSIIALLPLPETKDKPFCNTVEEMATKSCGKG